ncbi:hypothetical protein IAT40_005043 [Kwoniella sp. CBS 6097]
MAVNQCIVCADVRDACPQEPIFLQPYPVDPSLPLSEQKLTIRYIISEDVEVTQTTQAVYQGLPMGKRFPRGTTFDLTYNLLMLNYAFGVFKEDEFISAQATKKNGVNATNRGALHIKNKDKQHLFVDETTTKAWKAWKDGEGYSGKRGRRAKQPTSLNIGHKRKKVILEGDNSSNDSFIDASNTDSSGTSRLQDSKGKRVRAHCSDEEYDDLEESGTNTAGPSTRLSRFKARQSATFASQHRLPGSSVVAVANEDTTIPKTQTTASQSPTHQGLNEQPKPADKSLDNSSTEQLGAITEAAKSINGTAYSKLPEHIGHHIHGLIQYCAEVPVLERTIKQLQDQNDRQESDLKAAQAEVERQIEDRDTADGCCSIRHALNSGYCLESLIERALTADAKTRVLLNLANRKLRQKDQDIASKDKLIAKRDAMLEECLVEAECRLSWEDLELRVANNA